jgi:hypothetical protein
MRHERLSHVRTLLRGQACQPGRSLIGRPALMRASGRRPAFRYSDRLSPCRTGEGRPPSRPWAAREGWGRSMPTPRSIPMPVGSSCCQARWIVGTTIGRLNRPRRPGQGTEIHLPKLSRRRASPSHDQKAPQATRRSGAGSWQQRGTGNRSVRCRRHALAGERSRPCSRRCPRRDAAPAGVS